MRTRPRPDEAISPGWRRWGSSSLLSATSTRRQRVPRSPDISAMRTASPSVWTRTLVTISETMRTAESVWPPSGQSCMSSRICCRASAMRSGSAWAMVRTVRRGGRGTPRAGAGTSRRRSSRAMSSSRRSMSGPVV